MRVHDMRPKSVSPKDTRVVEPDDVSVLNPTPGRTWTLVTCYPFPTSERRHNASSSAPK
jgi:LPXTG-site transpeptidase (sortase) family protein